MSEHNLNPAEILFWLHKYYMLVFDNLHSPSWNVFEIKYKYLEDLSDLKNYMRSALRGCRV